MAIIFFLKKKKLIPYISKTGIDRPILRPDLPTNRGGFTMILSGGGQKKNFWVEKFFLRIQPGGGGVKKKSKKKKFFFVFPSFSVKL